ncbi:MAG: DUF2520 domain-containing protein [Maritimibacter sp.]|jgi:predicted short-subunit dehydrogenase-like oxidoreductase (DUF2520 family)|uniref:Rossmann-like and DUF2520 domain-containing protein n=1 Tax=Maritimibacter sp. TaxID=2003363 RepID=UPI001E002FEF|nr:DUF2520 domain-containing protein [Maritimibacter sp.]MBL6430247.1 DUF2520 domain-containing protein [Maritimibacter sp.]
MIRTMSLVGAGNVGRTLASLFTQNGIDVTGVTSRSAGSTKRAADLFGATPVERIEDLPETDLVLITTPDDLIADAAARLAGSGRLAEGAVLLHCSGATPSSVLRHDSPRPYHVASVHPVKTFTDPIRDAASFPGTYCGAEGDPEALDALLALFEKIGARCFRIREEHKLLYHTASVYASAYLFGIIKIAFDLYEVAGVDRDVAAEILDPIMHATVSNALTHGPEKTVTGPVSRGDVGVVERQIAALEKNFPDRAALYKALGREALDLSEAKGAASPESVARLKDVLGS